MSNARTAIWIAAIVLGLLHQDFWFWDDRTMVLGFMPVGLFYHAMFSLVAAALWALAVKLAWPDELEAWAEQEGPGEAGSPS